MACVRFSKENLCSNNIPEIHVFNSWRHQKVKIINSKIYFYCKNMKSTININSTIISKNKLCCWHNWASHPLPIPAPTRVICHGPAYCLRYNYRTSTPTKDFVITFTSSLLIFMLCQISKKKKKDKIKKNKQIAFYYFS